MPAIGNRRAQIKRNIGGGTSAPKGAAKSPTTGLGGRTNQGNQFGGWAPPPGAASGLTKGLSTPPQAGAPAPTQPQPVMPWDIAAANDEATAGKMLSDTLTGLDTGWLGAEQEFGIAPGWNDYTSNPYSRAALLQKSYDNAKRGSLNSAGQQLYAGSYINAQNTNTSDFSTGRNELEKARGRSYSEYQGNRQRAQNEYQEALNRAAWERVQAGLESEPEPAPYAGGGGAGQNPLPKHLQGTPSRGKAKGHKIAVSKGRKA